MSCTCANGSCQSFFEWRTASKPCYAVVFQLVYERGTLSETPITWKNKSGPRPLKFVRYEPEILAFQPPVQPSEKTTFCGDPLLVKPQSSRISTRDRWKGRFGKWQLAPGDQTQVGKVVVRIPHNRIVRSPQQAIGSKRFNRRSNPRVKRFVWIRAKHFHAGYLEVNMLVSRQVKHCPISFRLRRLAHWRVSQMRQDDTRVGMVN